MLEKLRLLIVIINYKTPELVCDALLSLEKEVHYETDKVVVVDNLSGDNSNRIISEFIERHDFNSWVAMVESGVNGGFSAGNNVGIQSYEADYYLLLNSDAYVRQGAISKMLRLAENQPRVSIVGPRLEWPDGKQQVSLFYHLTPLNSFLASVKLGVFTKMFSWFGVKEVAVPIGEHGDVKPDWISFACVLLKAEMIKDIGLMDDGYFMYREDNDYCRRATDAGWELAYESSAHVVHLNQGASNQAGVRRLPRFYFESRSRYFLKYYGRTGLLLANVAWSLGRFISIAREKLTSKPNAFHETMLSDIWLGFFSHVKGK
jgi:GT2 family glycosyltransferase